MPSAVVMEEHDIAYEVPRQNVHPEFKHKERLWAPPNWQHCGKENKSKETVLDYETKKMHEPCGDP